MKGVFLLIFFIAVYTSYGQPGLAQNTDSSGQIITGSLKVKKYTATDSLQTILQKLTVNCSSEPHLADLGLVYYFLSRKDSNKYKIIIMPIVEPTYEQLRNAFGVLTVDSSIVYCIGDVPTYIIEERRGEYFTTNIKNNHTSCNKRANFTIDFNADNALFSIVHGDAEYVIIVQPCNKRFNR